MKLVKVQLKDITKYYEQRRGVERINLLIEDGEYLAVLGPTGAGKTTTMYLIAGLVSPSEGSIHFDDEDITDIPAEDRNVGFVFEEYNLFPRMNVMSNVLFGPIVKDLDVAESTHIARELFSLLNIPGKEENFPDEISGGQKQRVALSRAIVSNAQLLVMDDPLRALDAKIREILQVELRNLVKDLGLTCIHATHDTQEAMRVADRIAVFKDGQIEQIGTPEEVYNYPKSIYVANFLGETSQIKGEIQRKGKKTYLLTKEGNQIVVETDLKSGSKAIALIPAELVDIFPLSEKKKINYDNILEATLLDFRCVGEFDEFELSLKGIKIKGKELIGKKVPMKKKSKVLFATDKGDYRIFPIEEENEK
ncbi:MAG: ABC transporter ATP-binding protein [Candidatus Heimdallarchaeaceae archaeon]|jgi:ABC-type Fe3+/spermidine/putrescine transport system ATPase subunit